MKCSLQLVEFFSITLYNSLGYWLFGPERNLFLKTRWWLVTETKYGVHTERKREGKSPHIGRVPQY
jgi:hypothetical protein